MTNGSLRLPRPATRPQGYFDQVLATMASLRSTTVPMSPSRDSPLAGGLPPAVCHRS
jgi:hypothetical protein